MILSRGVDKPVESVDSALVARFQKLTERQQALLEFLAAQERPTTVPRITRLMGLREPRYALGTLTALYRRGFAQLGDHNGRESWWITPKGRKRAEA